MKWNIVTDSSCDLFSKDYQKGDIKFSSVPFNIQIGAESFRDDEQLNKKKLLNLINEGMLVRLHVQHLKIG
ncbi:DegV family protein [Companilactobacillus farciminis]|uniref:DegV family protein n=1 Tax=Companilactobacillus farciminis TaxID=1612 RepID=UPI00232CB727|nr:DegV family protein [Companilactobacillus farciminis]WCG36127.1 DegV family protein [Companilactobacillus farciminis]